MKVSVTKSGYAGTSQLTNQLSAEGRMMAEIAVVHNDLMSKGGGESVCMNVFEALQDDHEMTLLTLAPPDFEILNDYFRTAVDPPKVELAGTLGPRLHRKYGVQYYVLQNALLSRFARKHTDDYDLLFSTINELGLAGGAIEYVHFPFDWSVNLDEDFRNNIFHPTIEKDGLYQGLCTTVAGITADEVAAGRLLANSEWTADAVETAYGVRPEIIYPPVDTAGFVNRQWGEREPGFVTIGRIERSKRIHELIEIVDRVRNRGNDIHLHIVGPVVDADYGDKIAHLADERSHVFLDGELSREALVNRICTHRFGIHGKHHEHFGMAVAELAAGGTIPFVPASGGPSVIIDDRSSLQFESIPDAVEKISRVLSNPSLQSDLRSDPETIRRRFGRERFQNRIAEMVRSAVDEKSERPPSARAVTPSVTD